MTINVSPAVHARLVEYAALINSGLRPVVVRDKMGLTKGEAAHAMRQAKALNMVENIDHAWLRKLNAKSAATVRDEIAEEVSQGYSLAEAAERLGLSFRIAQRHWTRIRMDLGWQAIC